MKKIISFLIAISFLASYSPVCSYADDTETIDLYALASSFGAETISEITYSEEVDKVITGYQCSQGYTYFDYYEKFLMTSNSYEQQIDLLLETAENSMKDNKYFWLVIRSEKFSHAVCGMGIADGDWEWNGKKYDKCILTLDSNSADADRNACACIYINSETKECYIPVYEIGMDKTSAFVAIDDDMFLNHKGTIKPSEEGNTNISAIKQVSRDTSANTKLYSVSADGNMTLFDDALFSDYAGKANFIKADSVHIDVDDEPTDFPNLRYISSDRWIDIEFLDETIAGTDFLKRFSERLLPLISE